MGEPTIVSSLVLATPLLSPFHLSSFTFFPFFFDAFLQLRCVAPCTLLILPIKYLPILSYLPSSRDGQARSLVFSLSFSFLFFAFVRRHCAGLCWVVLECVCAVPKSDFCCAPRRVRVCVIFRSKAKEVLLRLYTVCAIVWYGVSIYISMYVGAGMVLAAGGMGQAYRVVARK